MAAYTPTKKETQVVQNHELSPASSESDAPVLVEFAPDDKDNAVNPHPPETSSDEIRRRAWRLGRGPESWRLALRAGSRHRLAAVGAGLGTRQQAARLRRHARPARRLRGGRRRGALHDATARVPAARGHVWHGDRDQHWQRHRRHVPARAARPAHGRVRRGAVHGPVVGPIVSGFMTTALGWRWLAWIGCFFAGVVVALGVALLPEMHTPVVLARRETGRFHVTSFDAKRKTPAEVLAGVLWRPYVLLFREPIVLVASVYMVSPTARCTCSSAAFIIVCEQQRGWPRSTSGLTFLGIAVGTLCALLYNVLDNQLRYIGLGLRATPESRLLPLGMFAFASTNGPGTRWAASVILSALFGIGQTLVVLTCVNYLINSYTVYAASVLAGGSMMRCLFAAAFPLFMPSMYKGLGIHWASSIPAFMALALMPFPLLMHWYEIGCA